MYRQSCLVTKLCLTLCNLMDCSPLGSSVHGILQVGILEWDTHTWQSWSEHTCTFRCTDTCTHKHTRIVMHTLIYTHWHMCTHTNIDVHIYVHTTLPTDHMLPDLTLRRCVQSAVVWCSSWDLYWRPKEKVDLLRPCCFSVDYVDIFFGKGPKMGFLDCDKSHGSRPPPPPFFL